MFKEFLEYFDKGLKGETLSVPLIDNPNSDEISKLGSKIDVGKSMYLIFGGMSGSGKTAIVETYFLLNLYLWWLRNKDKTNIKPYWIVRSMERANFMKIAKWTAYLMFVDYGIVIDVPTILRKPNSMYDIKKQKHTMPNGRELSYEYIIKSYEKFFDEFSKHIDLKSGSDTASNVFKFAKSRISSNGHYVESNDKEIKVDGRVTHEFVNDYIDTSQGIPRKYRDLTILGKNVRIFENSKKFFEKDSNKIFFHLIDHIGKINPEPGIISDKQIIDLHSKYQGELRDIFYGTCIDIVQLNRNIEETDSKGNPKSAEISPKDFHGSSEPYHNCDIAIGMINPYKLKIHNYQGYSTESMVNNNGYNRFRGLKVIKNSWGIDDINLGYFFMGESGITRQLPKAMEMDQNIYEQIRIGTYGRT